MYFAVYSTSIYFLCVYLQWSLLLNCLVSVDGCICTVAVVYSLRCSCMLCGVDVIIIYTRGVSQFPGEMKFMTS